MSVFAATIDMVMRLLGLPDAGPPVDMHPRQFDLTADAVLFGLQDTTLRGCDESPSASRLIAAFLPADSPTGRSALLMHCSEVESLFLEDMAFGVDLGTVLPLASVGWRDNILALGRPAYLMLTGRFDAPNGTKRPLLTSPGALERLVTDLDKTWPKGVNLCLDLSGDAAAEAKDVRRVLAALRPLATARGARLCLAATVDAAFLGDTGVVAEADLILAKGFQEPERLPFPTAPQSWFDAAIARVLLSVPQHKLILALGTFGVQTSSATGRSEQVAYATAMAKMWGASGIMLVDSVALNTELEFRDPDGGVERVMLLDGMSFANQMRSLPSGTKLALWPLGDEDPAIWQLLAGETPRAALTRPIQLDRQVLLSGSGPIALLVDAATDGLREVTVDPASGQVVGQIYRVWPGPQLMQRIDGGVPDAIVIAFDGLPPAEYMSEVLGQLAKHGTHAIFTTTGAELVDNQTTARRLIAAGHAIALRTSGDLVGGGIQASLARLRDRASAMALASETGWRSILVETIGQGELLPTSLAEFSSLVALQNQGRIRLPTGERVPLDPEMAATFAERVVSTVFIEGSQLVRFDLSKKALPSTLATLPIILTAFESAGASFIAPDDLARPAGGVAMYASQDMASLRDRIYLWFLLKADSILESIFLTMLVVAVVRATAFLLLAHSRRPRNKINAFWAPRVTVVVPAHNEAMVIENCISSIFASDYPNVCAVVVDDGSQDETGAIVARIAAANPLVRLVQQANGGKWAASNTALRYIDTDYFIILDADSVLERDAIIWIMQPFIEPEIGAVSGIVEVGNSHNWLTSCQNLEYRVSQNIHRRAYEVFDGILVVPGAIGAWRTKAIIAAGLFSGETITEDADLTLAVHRAGFRVVMAENARAHTEAPEKVQSFMCQRLRWTLGMLQVSWKHKSAITDGLAVGYISILDAIWFSVLTTILSPVVDLIMVIAVAIIASRLMMREPLLDGNATMFLLGYLGLMLIDILNTLATFRFERRFSLGLLLLTPLLRLGYRQLLYVSTIRAVWRALTGRLTEWNKLKRTGAMNTKTDRMKTTKAIERSIRS
ncbi:MAG: glycosyltransferase [Paracoccaceae bacterium]